MYNIESGWSAADQYCSRIMSNKKYNIALCFIAIYMLDFNCWAEKPCYKRKTELVIGGTRTQVLADNMAIEASALNHCAT